MIFNIFKYELAQTLHHEQVVIQGQIKAEVY